MFSLSYIMLLMLLEAFSSHISALQKIIATLSFFNSSYF